MRWSVSSVAKMIVTGALSMAMVLNAGANEHGTGESIDFKTVLGLETVGGPRIAPDGGNVLYTVRTVDWDDNRYDSEVWIARTDGSTFQLTRTADGSSSNARWSPDGSWVSFVADRGDDRQIWLISPNGGEARPLTAVDGGISDYEWSPDGRWLAVAITEAQSPEDKEREEKFGGYSVEDRDFRMTHLWVLDFAAAVEAQHGARLPDPEDSDAADGDETDDGAGEEADSDDAGESLFRRLTSGNDFTVGTFRWSPDGSRIAFDHAPDPRVESRSHSDISVIGFVDGDRQPLVARSGPDNNPRWSPDGQWIVFSTGDGDAAYYLNSELAKVSAGGGKPEVLTEAFDEDARAVAWLEDGIRFISLDRTTRNLYRLDPDSLRVEPVEIDGLPPVLWSVDFSSDGASMALRADGPETLEEIYLVDGRGRPAKQLTEFSGQIAGWPSGEREVIRWTSKDGAEIEGVVIKPEGFDPSVRHPLMVIIHGGPSWLSFPQPVYGSVYPVEQWLAKGAVVLMPNYRGSAGYGEKFRSLNVRNLGVGDAWDVISGVDHLIEQGFVDPDRVASMGWSQGGYISAFLTTTSDRFKAISVGAGISNWMTYYVNTDIHPFTRHYLKSTPWDDPEVYAKTSPMTYINDASTPTLIQHGEFDRRVPTPNAYELYQGLQDVGVEVELIIYEGFGHGISKPKERLAAVWHNWIFFAKWIWGEEIELPVE